MMEKPITVRRTEFMQNMAKAINESKLPAFVVADCLTITLAEINTLASRQLQEDMEEWQRANEESEV